MNEDDPTTFRIFVAYPPEREGRVAELTIKSGDGVSIPADVYRENGQILITIFGAEGDSAWTFPLDDFRAALDKAAVVVNAEIPPWESPGSN